MKTLFFCLFCMISSYAAFSQTLSNPGTPEERAEKMTEKMKATLELDSVQVQKVDSLNLHYAKMAQEQILDRNLGKLATIRQGMRINAKKEAELKLVLDDRQWKKYLDLKSESRQQFMQKLNR